MREALTRRGFLAFGAGAGVVFGFAGAGWAAKEALVPEGGPSLPALDPGLWFAIDGKGGVTVHIAKAEMGQHIGTALGRALVEELGASWAHTQVVLVDSGPEWGVLWTGYSTSVADSWMLFRRAGAAGRQMLASLAGRRLGVPAARVEIWGGRARAGGRDLGFGELVREGFALKQLTADEVAALPLKRPRDWQLIGRPAAALDVPAKVAGATRFGSDMRVPGMLHARPKLPTTRFLSKLMSIDDHLAKDVPGYLKTIIVSDPTGTVDGWPVVVGESWLAVLEAAPLVQVDWKAGPGIGLVEKDIVARGRVLVDNPASGVGLRVRDGVVPEGSTPFVRYYATETVAHFEMEPLSALALERQGRIEIYTGAQGQSLILPKLAKALGRPVDEVVLKGTPLGGNLGRRLDGDYILLAGLVAQAMGQPVKLQLLREDDSWFESPRAPTVARLSAALSGTEVGAMEERLATGWPTRVNAPHLLRRNHKGKLYDPFAVLGASHLYAVGRLQIRAIENDALQKGFRPGYLRGGGAVAALWALESFVDELAVHLGEDPVAFRLRLLAPAGGGGIAGAGRLARVVADCAERAKWGEEGEGALGLAAGVWQTSGAPSLVACAARLLVEEGHIRVVRLTLTTDAGLIIEPRSAAAQTEGAALFGLSLALHEGTPFLNGRIDADNFVQYRPLRMADAPEVDSHFLKSMAPPAGVGEAMVGVVAPAIGNALYRATGVRLRHLPMGDGALAAALAARKQS